MRFLADADLVLESFKRDSNYVQDADQLLEIAESGQVQIYITDKCLEGIRCHIKQYADNQKVNEITSWIKKIFKVISIEDSKLNIFGEIIEQVSLQNYDSRFEIAYAIFLNLDAIVTHKPEKFTGINITVLSVCDLLGCEYISNQEIFLENLDKFTSSQIDLPEAEKNLLAAINLSECLCKKQQHNIDALPIIEAYAPVYRVLQYILVAQGKFEAALEVAERSRDRSFIKSLASRLYSPEAAELEIIPPTIQQIKQTAQEHQTTLVRYSVIDKPIHSQNEKEWREYLLFIWLINPDGEVTFRQIDLDSFQELNLFSLSDLIKKYIQENNYLLNNNCIVTRGLQVLEKVVDIDINSIQQKQFDILKLLYQILIEPIAHLLPVNPDAHVTFIPDRELFFVPFSALLDFRNKYLIEKHTILMSPSIQALDFTRQIRQRIRTKNKLIIGSKNTTNKIGVLEKAEIECLCIADIFNTDALIGNQAIKDNIIPKMASARIIHFAGHAISNEPNSAMASALTLASSDEDDGLLTAEEISNLKLEAELVVLSACISGLGYTKGDGITGLARSFLIAGASSVIASTYNVTDSYAFHCTGKFYRQWQINLDKAQALRQTILKIKEKYPNPFIWASYTLIGEAE